MLISKPKSKKKPDPNREYNRRKYAVLKTAANGTDLTPSLLSKKHGISYNLAKALLSKYKHARLLTHPRRGVYRISSRGRKRLAYFETRLKVGSVTGIDIGLNHHKDNMHARSKIEIIRLYAERIGELPYGLF